MCCATPHVPDGMDCGEPTPEASGAPRARGRNRPPMAFEFEFSGTDISPHHCLNGNFGALPGCPTDHGASW